MLEFLYFIFAGLEFDIYDAEGSAKGCGPYGLSGSVGGGDLVWMCVVDVMDY